MIELVIVMVVMAIIAAMGSRFIVTSSEMYQQSAQKSKLVNRGRQAIERMSRQLRLALPNSIRVSASGKCIEFMQIVGASTYADQVADDVNGAPLTSSVTTAPFDLGIGTAAYASIGPGAVTEIYSAVPKAIVGLGTIGTTGITTVNFSGGHRFARNSTMNRLFVAQSPTRYCVNASDELRVHAGYTLPTDGVGGLSDSAPNMGDILALDVPVNAETPFILSPGVETRGAVVYLQIPFEMGTTRIVLDHRVLVKNVP